MKEKTKELLEMVTGVAGDFSGAYNIREDSGCAGRNSTKSIQIVPHSKGLSGIEIHVAPHTKKENVYIPACVTKGGVNDLTYNDFYIGEGADITIVAGCGVHTDDEGCAIHNGIHRFFVGKGASVRYEEKHIATGDGKGLKRIDPVTEIFLEEDASMFIDTLQMSGIDHADRKTKAELGVRAKLIVNERLLTDGNEKALTDFVVKMNGEDCATDIVSRSVAKGDSRQEYTSRIAGHARCMGHTECDAILADRAVVTAIPQLDAFSPDAELIHEAAIGKVAGEQLLKLRTLGLTEEEAERKIIEGFLR